MSVVFVLFLLVPVVTVAVTAQYAGAMKEP